jgi:hypothetical protein
MSRLKIKVRLIGKRNQEFVRFILVPKNIKQGSKYLMTLGYWDKRPNTKTRYIVFNIYKVMYYYSFGLSWNNKILNTIYNYFVDIKNFNNWFYFNESKLRLLVENEIKNKYKFK